MTISVVKGQKGDLTKQNPQLKRIVVGLGFQTPVSFELDTSAFLLGANGKVSGDDDLIFYNNPSNSFIQFVDEKRGADQKQFEIELDKIPAHIEKIAFTLTIYEAERKGQSFKSVNEVFLRVQNGTSQEEILRYHVEPFTALETAIVIGELYRYKGEWKFNAIGSGFTNGLAALCGNFGIDVQERPKPELKPVPKPVPKPEPKLEPKPVPKPEPQPPTINLTKIELKKRGESINLTKKSVMSGEILVNLNWNQRKPSGGLFWRNHQGVDLDLACLYEFKNGTKGIIQALGKHFGSLTAMPYISLDGDDRTGAVQAGENIRINGTKLQEIKRILIFTFIYEGVTNWSEADGVVTIKQMDGPDIVVQLNEHDNRKAMCAIAMIHNVNDETFRIERLVQYYSGHRELDKAYGFGMRWVAGKK